MSDPENILARWARKKSEAHAAPKPAETSDGEAAQTDAANVSPGESPVPFDLTSLPAIESINAETDLRVFFAKGVPADMTRAALRAGWSADPAIRDFIGLSENSWDFNDPNAMHGFGTLDSAEVQKILSQMMGSAETNEAAQIAGPSSDGTAQALSDSTQGGSAPGQGPVSSDENSETLQKASEKLAAIGDTSSSAYRDSTVEASARDRREMTGQVQRDLPESHRRRHGGALPRIQMD